MHTYKGFNLMMDAPKDEINGVYIPYNAIKRYLYCPKCVTKAYLQIVPRKFDSISDFEALIDRMVRQTAVNSIEDNINIEPLSVARDDSAVLMETRTDRYMYFNRRISPISMETFSSASPKS